MELQDQLDTFVRTHIDPEAHVIGVEEGDGPDIVHRCTVAKLELRRQL